MLRHVDRRHLEQEGLQLEGALAAEGLTAQRIDLRDLLVRHGVTARENSRHAPSTARQCGERRVEGVGITGVEGQIERRLRIHLRRQIT